MYLTSESIDLGSLMAQVHSPSRGGIACFVGTVRDHHGGRAVTRLDYTAYVPMAEAECARIVGEAEARWACGIALQHRIGPLEIGDAAVAIVAAAAHRDEAFAACRYAIEELKRRVPVWKRELYADGTVEWVGAGGEAEMVSGEVSEPEALESGGGLRDGSRRADRAQR
jgi:molybdopterin synthase catalytic subunit